MEQQRHRDGAALPDRHSYGLLHGRQFRQRGPHGLYESAAVNLASRLEHEAPPGGMLLSFETYAHGKDEVRCEERGHVQIKGITQPVATYVVIGLKQDAEQAGTAHLRLELDADRMSDDERKAAADALRRALGLLEKGGQA